LKSAIIEEFDRASTPAGRRHGRVPDTDAVPTTTTLDPLSLRIVGALQVDGRASWRKVAEVLGEPVRTVARRGAALLEERTVQVVGLANTDPTHILRVRCHAGATDAVATAVAARDDSVFVYAVGQAPEVVAEVMTPYADVAALALESLPGVEGVAEVSVASALEYYRTVAEWSPELLTAAEAAALAGTRPEPPRPLPDLVLDDVDRALVDALVADGRAPLQDVAALLGCSDATARRRIDQLLARDVLRIRAVVEPALLGLPVETLIWVRDRPARVPGLGRAVVAAPYVRYCAFVAGEDQLLVDVATPDVDTLRRLLTDDRTLGEAPHVSATPLLRAYKRGGVLMPSA
jgi:DNA-binding Lrp family transcriptional regulator